MYLGNTFSKNTPERAMGAARTTPSTALGKFYCTRYLVWYRLTPTTFCGLPYVLNNATVWPELYVSRALRHGGTKYPDGYRRSNVVENHLFVF